MVAYEYKKAGISSPNISNDAGKRIKPSSDSTSSASGKGSSSADKNSSGSGKPGQSSGTNNSKLIKTTMDSGTAQSRINIANETLDNGKKRGFEYATNKYGENAVGYVGKNIGTSYGNPTSKITIITNRKGELSKAGGK